MVLRGIEVKLRKSTCQKTKAVEEKNTEASPMLKPTEKKITLIRPENLSYGLRKESQENELEETKKENKRRSQYYNICNSVNLRKVTLVAFEHLERKNLRINIGQRRRENMKMRMF